MNVFLLSVHFTNNVASEHKSFTYLPESSFLRQDLKEVNLSSVLIPCVKENVRGLISSCTTRWQHHLKKIH